MIDKIYVVTYIDQDGDHHNDVHNEMQDAQKSVIDCFERGYDSILVYEAVEMEISINVSFTAKKELPF